MDRAGKSGSGSFAIHLIIFLAGFTFLIYEVSWNRLLSLVLGGTVTASTIVLATFMGGFGLGAWFWGGAANDRQRIGRLLALLLAGVGLFSGLNYLLITRTIPLLYSSLAAGGVATGSSEGLVFCFASTLLFIPAFLMGGVFPLSSKIAVGSGSGLAATLGRLYAVETLGSALGGLLTGFVLLGALGQRNTLVLAVAINLLLGLWLVLSGRFNDVEQPQVDSPVATSPRESKRKKGGTVVVAPAALRRSALLGALLCGLSILTLQVLWLRMFRIYMTNTSYTFALVSSLAILGLFTGSMLFKRREQRSRDSQGELLGVLLLMATVTGLGLLLLVNLPATLMLPLQSVLENPAARVLLLPLIASLLIIFPPAVLSGYAFPLTCCMYADSRGGVSRDVGFVLMVNTIGSVVGPVAAAFLLIPLLGTAVAVLLVIALLVGGALLITLRWRRTAATGFRVSLIAVFVILVGIVGLRPEIRILPPSFTAFDRDILFYRESVEGTLTVGKDKGTRAETKYTYVNNASVIGSTYDAVKVVKMVGHYPFLLGLDCSDVLVIGFGIGVTTSAIASHPEVQSIECVELVPGLKDAARYYSDLNRNVVADSRLEIIPGDGRHYLQRTPKKYDLISCDPTHPILGSGNLYTAEYFSMCREHLNSGGMVSQYLPLHKLRTEEFMGIIATFHSVFPHSSVWLGHYHAVLLGSLEPLQVDFADWSAEVTSVGQDNYFYIDPYHFAATLMLDGDGIGALATASRINTDDHSYTEFFAPACLAESNLTENLRFLADNKVTLDSMFTNIDDPGKMARYLRGSELLTESIRQKMAGDTERSLITLRRACDANPENEELPFLIRFYY
ncbi:MAG: hypothetical protein GY835_01895 [bacterium]|nr:hypothetical protein [bacterium]